MLRLPRSLDAQPGEVPSTFPYAGTRKGEAFTADILPTVLEVLDLPIPSGLDGVGEQALPAPAERHAMIYASIKLVRTTQREDGASEDEYYDLSRDPLERRKRTGPLNLPLTINPFDLAGPLDSLLLARRDMRPEESLPLADGFTVGVARPIVGTC